jgi:hypothetical protein
MIPEYESLNLSEKGRSFHFFRKEVVRFEPYWHFHPELELTYIEKGFGLRFIGDHIENFSDHDLVLTGSNLPHHWVSSPESKTGIAFVLQFPKELFSRFPELNEIQHLLSISQQGLKFLSPSKQVFALIRSMNHSDPLKQFQQLLRI